MRIHIFGASGSGTTTIGKALEEKFSIKHFDTDDFYWEPTNPKFQLKRDIAERIRLMELEFAKYENWVLTGSLCGWGDVFIESFDLVVFLYLQKEIRLHRLVERETNLHGIEAVSEGGIMHKGYNDFL